MSDDAVHRLAQWAQTWRVSVENTLETNTSLIAFGNRGGHLVVLKVLKRANDEWNCGEVVAAFQGRGVVRAFEHGAGAVLLERLRPGTPLVTLVRGGSDDHALDIIAEVIDQLRASEPPRGCPTVEEWARAFDRFLERDESRIPAQLVHAARDRYLQLCASQEEVQLLHGDLHHYNVLKDTFRGWTAIDPKGVVGELHFEVGAALRNPIEMPAVITSPSTVHDRVERFSERLGLDAERLLGWAFAQAVMSAIWSIEDGSSVDAADARIALATTIEKLSGGRS